MGHPSTSQPKKTEHPRRKPPTSPQREQSSQCLVTGVGHRRDHRKSTGSFFSALAAIDWFKVHLLNQFRSASGDVKLEPDTAFSIRAPFGGFLRPWYPWFATSSALPHLYGHREHRLCFCRLGHGCNVPDWGQWTQFYISSVSLLTEHIKTRTRQ